MFMRCTLYKQVNGYYIALKVSIYQDYDLVS
jgi:hypothetical protein